MSKLKGFFNQVLKNNRIFTAEDIGEMSSKEFGENEKAIDYQMNNLGIPKRNDLQDSNDAEFVNGYTRADGTQVKPHYRVKSNSSINQSYNGSTGFATGISAVDKEFDKSLNFQIKGVDTKIPDIRSYAYYNKLNDKFDKEVGDFLNKNTINPKMYSNDIRHQYVSALYARNLGQDVAKQLGNLNEAIHFSNTGSGTYDTAIDHLNNEIGRSYAIKYPEIPKEDLLKLLLKDWEKNSMYSIDKLNNKK